MIRHWVRDSIDEPIAEAMVEHTWPQLDVSRMTVAEFNARVDWIPGYVKRRFRYQVFDRTRMEFEQSEFDRIEAYTNFDRVK